LNKICERIRRPIKPEEEDKRRIFHFSWRFPFISIQKRKQGGCMGYGKSSCVNIYCGDNDYGHDDHEEHHDYKKERDCCNPCDAVKEGKAFVVSPDIGYITPIATEVPGYYISNPSGSGKNLYILARNMTSIGSDDMSVLFRYYWDPTLTSVGTVVPQVNLNAQTPVFGPSVAKTYSTPGVSSFGTLIDMYDVSVAPFTSVLPLIIGEGHSLLVTYFTNAQNVRGGVQILWTDCKKRHCDDDDKPMIMSAGGQSK
jgi:hypothetical protein